MHNKKALMSFLFKPFSGIQAGDHLALMPDGHVIILS